MPQAPSRQTESVLLHATVNLTQYLALTVALGGLQFVWAVETGYGTPYLLSLGMKKSHMSLVWLAGPLSGLFTQPLVGVLSDDCTSKFGRRRPYIVGATIGVVLCLTAIGWTREIVGSTNKSNTPAILLAVASFYLLDFAINCIQASLRALIVDKLPPSKQDTGTAWASRMIGIGNVMGYMMGYIDLVRTFPYLGTTQLQILTTIASLILVISVGITCWFTTEVPIKRTNSSTKSVLAKFRLIFSSMNSLPYTIKSVCRVQLFSWIGWFPFLFYNTTYVTSLYIAEKTNDDSNSNNGDASNSLDDLINDGTRAGSYAMCMYAVSSLVFSLILPQFAYSTHQGHTQLQAVNTENNSSIMYRSAAIVRRIIQQMAISLPTMWIISLSIFSISMMSTFFVYTVNGAVVLIMACGFSWAVTIWVPFSIIGETISSNCNTRQDSPFNDSEAHVGSSTANGPNNEYVRVDSDEIPLATLNAPNNSSNECSNISEDASINDLSAGTILGIHNIFIVLPQFITAFVSSLIFTLFEHNDSHTSESEQAEDVGINRAQQIAWVLRLGGLSSMAACYYVKRLLQ